MSVLTFWVRPGTETLNFNSGKHTHQQIQFQTFQKAGTLCQEAGVKAKKPNIVCCSVEEKINDPVCSFPAVCQSSLYTHAYTHIHTNFTDNI